MYILVYFSAVVDDLGVVMLIVRVLVGYTSNFFMCDLLIFFHDLCQSLVILKVTYKVLLN